MMLQLNLFNKIYVPVSGVGGIWVGLMNKHY